MAFLQKINLITSKKLLTEKDAITSRPKIAKGDLKDALMVVLFCLGFDEGEDRDEVLLDDVIRTWNSAVKAGKIIKVPMAETKKYSYFDHGRRVKKHYLNNPIIVAKVGGDMVVLDGNHRLLTRKEQNKKDIEVFVINLPYGAISEMEGSVDDDFSL